MKIVMDKKQYEELEDLVEFFEGAFLTGDGLINEEVNCFEFIKKIVDSGDDTDNIPKEEQEKMQKQMIEVFDWIENIIKGIHVKIEYKDQFLSYFCSDTGQASVADREDESISISFLL
ncbi:MAG: hypothetical protein K2N89_14670 [Lachnospiraceae bacterium]|nr:hypothetical protein [Lachnospiraceae bacterium]